MNFAQLYINKIYSYTDYSKWKFEERVELIRGRISKMSPAPDSLHQVISREISGELWYYLKGKPRQVFSAPFDVRLPSMNNTIDNDIFTVVQPDTCVICDATKVDARGCVGAPDIVIEILSPSNSEKELKHKYYIYEKNGVREYRVVFPVEKTMLIYTLVSGKFVPLRLKVRRDVFTSDILPAFTLDLSVVFPAYDTE